MASKRLVTRSEEVDVNLLLTNYAGLGPCYLYDVLEISGMPLSHLGNLQACLQWDFHLNLLT